MQTLDALSRHIATTEEFGSIVHTMKSLSAVSIRQYEKAAAALAEYHRGVELGLTALLRQTPSLKVQPAGGGAIAAIVFGSDHGLCGQFNEEIAGFACAHLAELGADAKDCPIVAVGFRAATRLETLGGNVEETLALPGSAAGLTQTVQSLILKMDEWREDLGIVQIRVFHNRHTDEATAQPQAMRLLPLDLERLDAFTERRWPSRMLPLITMDARRLFSALLREYLFVVLFRSGAESMASEHASRLAAMQAAERNIKEHLEDANAEYRRRRQEQITDEILDVISGFEALAPEPGTVA